MMTCLAAGGQFKAVHKRWNAIKLHGLRRDVGMYRLMFALASLNPVAAQRAIVVVKNEMNREVPKKMMDWDTYTAMLDCCVTSQSSVEAKEIMKEMRHQANIAVKEGRYPYKDEPSYYLPLLRTAVMLPGLDADALVRELDAKKVVYSQGIWEALLSKEAMEGSEHGIQQLFNKYTMTRFEKDGKIPVPVREEPVVPFPSAPYNALDMQFIDVYICSLLDSQDISLVMDVLRALREQTSEIGISARSIQGVVRLARQEKSLEELKWIRQEILPNVSKQNKTIRNLMNQIDFIK
jgi:pentatricopeptide repeat protein